MADLDRAGVIQAVVVNGRKDLRGLDLSGADLSELQLEGVDFSGCRLNRTKFTGANLTNARFDRVNAKNAVFSNANLFRASMADGLFEGASFGGAKLSGTTFDRSDLQGVRLAGESCIGCSFEETWMPEKKASKVNVENPPMLRPTLDVPSDSRAAVAPGAGFSRAMVGF